MTKEVFMSMTKKEIVKVVAAKVFTTGLNGKTEAAEVENEVRKLAAQQDKLRLYFMFGEKL